jgi:hypothetical protein
MQKWLKPGGRLLITDYCCKEGPHSPEYAAYVEQRHYHVLSPQKYGELLSNVGFVNVRAEDRTEQFVQVLQTELARIKSIENEFTKVISNFLPNKSIIPVCCSEVGCWPINDAVYVAGVLTRGL